MHGESARADPEMGEGASGRARLGKEGRARLGKEGRARLGKERGVPVRGDVGHCEDRVLDGPASGGKGLQGPHSHAVVGHGGDAAGVASRRKKRARGAFG